MGKNTNIGIYLIRNRVDGKVYIGQSVNLRKRKNDFFNFNRIYGGDYINKARKKYNDLNYWDYSVLEYCKVGELDNKEKYYIALYESNDPAIGYNLTEGGGGMRGFRHTEETKRKMSEAQKGKKLSPEQIEKLRLAGIGKRHSDETKKKMSDAHRGRKKTAEARRNMSECRKGEKNPMYGKHLTEETKQKISEANSGERSYWYGKHLTEEQRRKISEAKKGKKLSDEHRRRLSEAKKGNGKGRPMSEEHRRKLREANIGRPLTEEHKRKLSEAHKGKYVGDKHPQSKKVVQLTKDGEYVATFNSMSEAAKKFELKLPSISQCCLGKQKTAGGFIWRYADADTDPNLYN